MSPLTLTTLPMADAPVPTEWGMFRCHAFRDQDGVEHLAFAKGDVHAQGPVLVRVHSECLTGDVFGSRRCDSSRTTRPNVTP
jgi:3,4-dihydroxy 2-butanone 4-phosphate synthase/GTP cyclohydrolase II